MINVNLYQYSGKNNVINKRLENTHTVTGLFVEPFNIFTPQIKLRCIYPFNYNYVYISTLNKYYFITDKEILNATTILLTLKLDVLKTYENSVLAATATVTSKENANGFINTRVNIHDLRPIYEKLNFSNETPFSENGTIIVVTLKGNV